ncbi:MAG: extracellular solute-binding protein [Bacillota bacterium]
MLRNSMKQWVSTLLISALAVGTLAGCGGSEPAPAAEAPAATTETPAATAEEAPAAEETATGYTGNLVISIHDQLNNLAVVEALDYLQTTDKWKDVDFDIRPQDQEYEINLPIHVMGGQQIDVMYNFNPIEQDKNSSAGIIQPIDDALAELGIDLEEKYGNYAVAAYNDGEAFAIPGGVTAWGLFYNKNLFDEAGLPYPDPTVPMTWSEYRDLAVQLTSGSGVDKIYGTLHLEWPMYWYGEAIMTLGGGQAFYNEEGLSNIEDPVFRETIEAVYNMQNVDGVTPTMADIVARKIEPDGFFNGNYAMYLHGTWFLNWLADTETYPRDYEIGFAPMPVPDGTTQRQTWGVTGTYAVPATSADPVMATDFCVDLVAEITQRTSSEIFVDQTVSRDNLFVSIADEIEDGQFTTEAIQDLFMNPDQLMISEKVSGPNAAKYEAVLIEEVEKYFADAQDLDTTISNIKTRGDKAILE